jgi:glycosyltransferase involved in cell wall biosynthesis
MIVLTDFITYDKKISLSDGTNLSLIGATKFGKFLSKLYHADMIVINGNTSLAFKLVLLFWTFPFLKKPIVLVDQVLRIPANFREKMKNIIKRMLFARIHHFIHYFKDLRGYEKYFGITKSKSSYVPFKANIKDKFDKTTIEVGEEYIFTVGRSQRDYDTFIRAVSSLPYPARMSEYSLYRFEDRDKNFAWHKENLPNNLRLLEDSGSYQDMIDHIARAKIVVIPTLKTSICASGISTYIDAMYLGKCVIISEGPGASDVLTNQAILVPPGDPVALRDAIVKAWENDEFRRNVATAGHRYVLDLGGEGELIQRIMEASCSALDIQKKVGAP